MTAVARDVAPMSAPRSIGRVRAALQAAARKRTATTAAAAFALRDEESAPRPSDTPTTATAAPFKFYAQQTPRKLAEFKLRRRFVRRTRSFEWHVVAVYSQAAWEQGAIRPRDVLESIDGTRVHELQLDEIARIQSTLRPPIVFRFRPGRSPGEKAPLGPRPCRGRAVTRSLVLRDHQRLGVKITCDGADRVPVVSQLGPSNATSHHHDLRLGDVLLAVNGTRVVGMSTARITAMLSGYPRPLRLEFQRWSHNACGVACSWRRGRGGDGTSPMPVASDDVLDRDYWSRRHTWWSVPPPPPSSIDAAGVGDDDGGVLIVWRTGPLGMSLVVDPLSRLPMVNRLTGKGSSLGLERVRHGDCLASINGHSTIGRPVMAICALLERIPKPVRLLFVPPFEDSASSMDLRGWQRALRKIPTGRSSPTHSSSDLSTFSETSEATAEAAAVAIATAAAPPPPPAVPSSLADDTGARPANVYEVVWESGAFGVRFGWHPSNDADPARIRILVQAVHAHACPPARAHVRVGHQLVAVNGDFARVRVQDFSTTIAMLTAAPKPVVLSFAPLHEELS